MTVLWWDAEAVGQLLARKAQLEANVAALQANRDTWARQGMLEKLEWCGPRYRPCVRVDEGAGKYGEKDDYRVILGYQTPVRACDVDESSVLPY